MKMEPMGDYLHAALDDATQVFVHPTRKFKTTTVKITSSATLDGRASWQALIPGLLRRGTRQYPTMVAISRALESLYGAALAYDVSKLGDRQVVSWILDVVGERFVTPHAPVTNNLFGEGIDLLGDILLNPLREEGAFRRDYLEQERNNLVHHIEALINDKTAYATHRMLEEMYAEDPYALYEWGTAESLRDVEAGALHGLWRERATKAPIAVYVVGDVEPGQACEAVRRLIPPERSALPDPVPVPEVTPAGEPRQIVEEQPVAQSKMVIGCRVDMQDLDEPSFVALGLMNTLLGGGMHSRLFKQVREKESLAYYASSGLDRIKGCLIISCGIDAAQFEKARDISLDQIRILASGEFEDDEFKTSRRAVLNRLRSVGDAAGGLIDFLITYRATGRHPAVAEIIAQVEAATRDQVVAAARRVHPQTIYLMKGVSPSS